MTLDELLAEHPLPWSLRRLHKSPYGLSVVDAKDMTVMLLRGAGRGRGKATVAAMEYLLSLANQQPKVERLVEALEQIAKGEGTYSRDQLKFANNVIDKAIRTAQAALDALKAIER